LKCKKSILTENIFNKMSFYLNIYTFNLLVEKHLRSSISPFQKSQCTILWNVLWHWTNLVFDSSDIIWFCARQNQMLDWSRPCNETSDSKITSGWTKSRWVYKKLSSEKPVTKVKNEAKLGYIITRLYIFIRYSCHKRK